jgi:hypothetical protein
MKTRIIFPLAVMLLLSVFAGCKKEKTQPVSNPLNYTAIVAQQTTIAIGATTTITANATGDGLSYTWSASAGDIIGSGSQITYGAPTCCAGQNTITCVVKDSGGNQQSKSVTITVQ